MVIKSHQTTRSPIPLTHVNPLQSTAAVVKINVFGEYNAKKNEQYFQSYFVGLLYFQSAMLVA